MSAPGLLAVLVAVLAAAAAALGFKTTTADTAAKTPAEVRLDRLATVARQLYHQEAHSAAATAAAARIAQDPAVIAAVRAGDAAALRQAALNELGAPGPVVRVGITGGGARTDVGRTFTVGGPVRVIAGGSGAVVQTSVQDVAAYVNLVHRRTGLEAIVSNDQGHTYSSLPPSRRRVPRAGVTEVAGRALLVRSFTVRGWNGRTLQVRLLGPA